MNVFPPRINDSRASSEAKRHTRATTHVESWRQS